MRSLIPFALLLAASVSPVGPAVKAGPLEVYKDRARPLILFAPDERNPYFQRELSELKTHTVGLRERQVVVLVSLAKEGTGWRKGLDSSCWPEFSRDAGVDARRRFGVQPGAFAVLLIGKDGGEKMTVHRPLTMDRLEETIDAMPMRQQEIHQR